VSALQIKRSKCRVLIQQDSNISLVIVAPASLAIADDLNEHSAFLLVFYITVDNLGEALAPLYVGPMSERLGRLPVVHLYNFLFVIFTMVSGFSQSVAQIVVFRFLAGASVASIALNPSIIGDLFSMEQRGGAIAIMSLIPILGTAVGPIVGGYVTQYLNWRWTFWITSIASGFLSLVLVLAMKETYVPVIRKKASKVKTRTPSKYIHGWNLKTLRAVCLLVVRPFIILSGSSVAIVMTLYLSVSYGYLSLVGATMATTFQQVYGFSESSSGLIYISLSKFVDAFLMVDSKTQQPSGRFWAPYSAASRSTTLSRMVCLAENRTGWSSQMRPIVTARKTD
jgi:MFS family permease